MSEDTARILIVDDDPQVLDLYSKYLADSYSVVTAADGEEALEEVDEDIDIVLLDRRMPGLSGDEVLEEIRARNLDCPVIMATAVDPGAEIITMPFNEYLLKPISVDELENTIERTLALARRDIQMQEYFSLMAKRHALEETNVKAELNEEDSYTDLLDQIHDLRDRIDPPIQDFEEEFAAKIAENVEQ